MHSHIELNRTFLPSNENADFDPEERVASLSLLNGNRSWDEVIALHRVVILAEAGAGKTHELRIASRKLIQEEKFAFFIQIEDLPHVEIEDALIEGDPSKFQLWKKSDLEAWFFLDSVDEARLTNHRNFDYALSKISRSIGQKNARLAHVIISSRASDWRPVSDLEVVNRWLPPLENEHIHIFELAPLTADQMRRFAEGQELDEPDKFMEAIDKADAQIFAERPQDLLELISYWKEHQSIGNHEKMHDFNIEKKLSEPDPNRANLRPLSKESAIKGASFIAAALTLTKKATVFLPDHHSDPTHNRHAIKPVDILPDWHNCDIQTLLGRALFDEATYGRVRFHHRSVREYLAAKWLLNLLKIGKHRRSIEKLLFTKRYGIELVRPSMAPIAAWMALWDDRIYILLEKIAPEIIISFGDPSILPITSKARLVQNFALNHSGHDETSASFDIAAVRRVADPRLSQTIKKIFNDYPNNESMLQLLLDIIWQGKIEDCADLAISAATDEERETYTRVCAIRALFSSATSEQKIGFAQTAITNRKNWNNRLLGAAIGEMFPDYLGIQDLLKIVQSISSPSEWSMGPLEWPLEQIINSKTPISLKKDLLSGFVKFLDKKPYVDEQNCRISQKYVWLTGYAAKLAEIIISHCDTEREFGDDIIQAISFYEIKESYTGLYYTQPENKLSDLLKNHAQLRYGLIWHAVKQQGTDANGNQITVWHQAFRYPVRWKFPPKTFDLFLEDVRSDPDIYNRMIALSVAISVWRQRVGVVNGRKRLWEAASKEPKLAKKLASELSNKRSKEAMILHRKRRKQKRKWERRKEKQASLELEREQKWISLLRNNKDRLKVGQTDTIDDLERNLYGLWHEMRGNSSDKFDKWGLSNWEVLKLKFGQAVAKAASNGFQAFWRHYTPMLPSEKNMNSVPKGLVVGLTGLSIESQKANWAHNLSIKEASLACRYAILEMNGFPEWVLDVIDAHPKAFDAVMEKQIVWEFERSSENQGHLTALYAIKNGPEVLREVYAPFLLRLLKKADPQNPVTLEYMLQILLHWVNLNTQSFALVARNRYKKSLERGRRITWLVAMMFVDANSALSSLRRWVEIKDKNKATDRMIDFCNAFFPQHNVRFNSVHRDYERIEILKKLIPLAYSHIRAEEDIIHEGVYEPNRRDDAQSVRNHFLSKVCNLPGRESYEALIHLSNVLTNKRSRDRMLVLARERAASDGDLEAWNAIDVQLFSEDAEKTPRSAQELFDLACDRLDDIKLDLEEGDSSPAQILKNVTKETDLRVWFSYILLKTSHHQYSIPPEEELADATRPDLRLHSPNIDAPIAIELKIADKWSGGELEERLQNQLVGQYLRDARSQYGIFLLVRIKKTRWKDGNSKKFLSFIDVVKRLNQIADDILKTRRDLLGIKTIGIDLAKRSTPTLMA